MSEPDVKDEAPAQADGSPAEEPEASLAGQPEASLLEPSAALEAEIHRLRQQLEEKEQEARTNWDRLLRERAELENFKRRMQREKAEALRFATEPLVRELIPVIDNLERAVEHGGGDGQSVIEGVRMVLKSLLDILERHGVKRIDAVGEQFDPARHEAMAQVHSPEHEPNQVVEQHHSGYMLHDRLLRPALVTVSGRKSNGAVETGQNSD